MVKNLSVNVLPGRSRIYRGKNFEIDKKLIHNIVNKLMKELEFEISGIIINFISSTEIMKINKEFLNHNYPTDIITFDYSETKKILDGEIFISVEDAAVNAIRYGVKLNKEIMRLIIHGFLHLLGFDDQPHNKKIVMKKIENQLLNKYKSLVDQG